MEENEITTTETLSDEATNVPSADGVEADSVQSLKDVLGTALGKNFKDDASALKAVKDTFSYVGEYGKVKPLIQKVGGVENLIKTMEQLNQPQPEVAQPQQPSPDLANKVDALAEELFYTKNPEYAPYKEVIKKMGSDPNEVVNSDVFKGVYEKVKLADETSNSKSVIHSSPRLGQVTDKMSKAGEALKAGDYRTAENLAVDAVIESLDLRKTS